jgi:hypothetical protein
MMMSAEDPLSSTNHVIDYRSQDSQYADAVQS